eukprot:746731-Hanusia_phi.AAC.1
MLLGISARNLVASQPPCPDDPCHGVQCGLPVASRRAAPLESEQTLTPGSEGRVLPGSRRCLAFQPV